VTLFVLGFRLFLIQLQIKHTSKRQRVYPPRDGKGLTISENFKSCQGPVLNCRGSRKRRASYLNEWVIHEIRNNASVIFQNFLFSCCKREFVQCGKNPLKPLPSVGGLSLIIIHIEPMATIINYLWLIIHIQIIPLVLFFSFCRKHAHELHMLGWYFYSPPRVYIGIKRCNTQCTLRVTGRSTVPMYYTNPSGIRVFSQSARRRLCWPKSGGICSSICSSSSKASLCSTKRVAGRATGFQNASSEMIANLCQPFYMTVSRNPGVAYKKGDD
jgi:hypothetical protein